MLFAALAALAGPAALPSVREILVPFDELHLLLANETDRVLLPRAEYEALEAKARRSAEREPPHAAVTIAAAYDVTVETDRAAIAGQLTIHALKDGLHAIDLDVSGVGVRRAQLDGRAAPLGRGADGGLTLFVAGQGPHILTIEAVAPIETTAARQILNLRVPVPAAATMALTIPGDVELRSGAAVMARVYDEASDTTRFQLLPTAGQMSLVMTLNSRLRRRDRAVLVRGVLVDELTQAYERLHATLSCTVLHRGVDNLRLRVPPGFDVTEVSSPHLAAWDITEDGGRRILTVHLREETTETVVLALSALRTGPVPDTWSLPRFEPLDVVGSVTVAGLLLESRLEIEHFAATGLIPIDHTVIQQALPPTLATPEPGSPTLRPVFAYYAPSADFALNAAFQQPPAKLRVTTNLVLTLSEKRLEVQGGLAVLAERDKRFGLDLLAPPAWDLVSVTAENGQALAFERYVHADGAQRIHIRLPQGLAPGQVHRVLFHALCQPPGWLGRWRDRQIDFPVFALAGTSHDTGAIAVQVDDDLRVQPLDVNGLTPLNENEKQQFGLANVPTQWVYRYDMPGYGARLAVDRVSPRVTAEVTTFVRLERDVLRCRYELDYSVDEARVHELIVTLPADTPRSLTIAGLGSTVVKDYAGIDSDQGRQWTVRLAESARGLLRIAIDFEQGYDTTDETPFVLPLPVAGAVEYQSGLIAIEGSAELDVRIVEHPRRVDIGELAEAEYQPGARLLGAFGYVGDPPDVAVSVRRAPQYPLPPAMVQRAEIATVLDAHGTVQTAARYLLRTKALFIEAELPPRAILWSVRVDNSPVRPQQRGNSLLIDLPATGREETRDLHVIFEAPASTLGLLSRAEAMAPRLRVRGAPAESVYTVPQVEAAWHLYTPAGYRVVAADGSLTVAGLQTPQLAVARLPAWLYRTGGGVRFDHSLIALLVRNPLPVILLGCLLGAIAILVRYVRKRQREAPTTVLRLMLELMIVLAILAILAGMMLPALSQSREKARSINCSGNLKQIGLACRMFSADHNEQFPNSFADLAQKGYLTAERVYGCPSYTNPSPSATNSDYTYVGAGLTDSGPAQTRTVVAYCDKHHRLVNVLVADGSVRSTVADSIQEAVAKNQWLMPGLQDDALPAQPAVTAAAFDRVAEKGAREEFRRDAIRREPQKVMSGAMRPRAPILSVAEKAKPTWALEGVRGLSIELSTMGSAVLFRGFSESPRVRVTLANRRRLQALAAAVAAAVFVGGMTLTDRDRRAKVGYVATVLAMSTALPALPGVLCLAAVFNAAFCAGLLLIPAYLLAPVVVQVLRRLGGLDAVPRRAPAAVPLVLAFTLLGLGASGRAAESAIAPPVSLAGAEPIIHIIEPPPEPLTVPHDALIVPYDSLSGPGIKAADDVLVPRARFEQLWELAHPELYGAAVVLPAPYALAGLALEGTLEDGEFLVLAGTLDIEVFADGFVDVPLPLAGAVLADARVDGQPARLRVDAPGPVRPEPRQQHIRRGPWPSVVRLTLEGKGRHQVAMVLQARLERRGGWRVANAVLPAAPATAVELHVPAVNTEVRLSQVSDRQAYTTTAANELMRTALGEGGRLSVQWRPAVAEGQVDRSLTATSRAVFDVLEDSLRLDWDLRFELRHGEREFFTLGLPADYLVEKVEGTNVRGWEVRDDGRQRRLDVALLKPARDSEQFSVRLWQQRSAGTGEGVTPVAVPQVTVPDALRHVGSLVVRRTPALDVRMVDAAGLSRVDMDIEQQLPSRDAPFGIRPFQAYEFVATPFTLRLAVRTARAAVTARLQTILRLAAREVVVQSRMAIEVRDRPVHRLELRVPVGLHIDELSAIGLSEWSAAERNGHKHVLLYFAEAQEGDIPILLRGHLPGVGTETEAGVTIPRLEVLDVERCETDIAVQADPAWDVHTADLVQLDGVLLERVYPWLEQAQRPLARLALHAKQADYSGRLVPSRRKSEVSCHSITNVRITDRAIEETTLIEADIHNAGIQEFCFRLPAYLEHARIQVPLLRQKDVGPDADADGMLLVRLHLQEQVMNQLRVLIEHDRPLTQEHYTIQLPAIATGRTDRQYLAVESAGRDEVIVEPGTGFAVLNRQQREWRMVEDLLQAGLTEVYIAKTRAVAPQAGIRIEQRRTVETVGARIGLARTVLMLDRAGRFRGVQTFHMDNRTEQHLEVAVPDGASIWTARVAGELVRPRLPDPAQPQRVHVPLVKTAAGDLDYTVELKYGGKVGAIWNLATVRFPLLHTCNVNVELSQVELWLPVTHRWLHFTGTMQQAGGIDEFEAGLLAYQNRLAKRLLQSLEFGSVFEQARAKANIKQLGQTLAYSQKRGYSPHEEMAKETAAAASLLADMDRQLEADAPSADSAAEAWNRSRLNQSFQNQRNLLARDQVLTIGANWDVSSIARKRDARATVSFDHEWLAANRLVAAPQAVESVPEDKAQPPPLRSEMLTQAAPQAIQLRGIADGRVGEVKIATSGVVPESEPGAAPRGDRRAVASRYQKRLEAQQLAVSRSQFMDTDGDGLPFSEVGARVATGRLPLVAAPTTGLVSLDVSLPGFDSSRWRRFHFSAPRGECLLAARAFAEHTTQRATDVGLAAVALILLAAVRRLGRTSRVLPRTGRVNAAKWLLVGGLVGILTGIFPVYAAVALALGLIGRRVLGK